MAISASVPEPLNASHCKPIVSFTANSSSVPNLTSLFPSRRLRFEMAVFSTWKARIVNLIASISRARTSDKRTRIERRNIKWRRGMENEGWEATKEKGMTREREGEGLRSDAQSALMKY